MRVVTAGTPYLAEGMKVRLLPEVEQAEPRMDDLKIMLMGRCDAPPAAVDGTAAAKEGESGK